MAFNTSNQLNSIVQLFSSMALPALRKTLKMGSLINRAYDSTPGTIGSTVNIAIPPVNVSANSLNEGSDVQYQQTSLSNVAVVVGSHVESSFQVTDVAQILTNLDLYKTYFEPHVVAVAEKIESDIFAEYVNAGTSAVGASATPLTSAVIGAAETALYSAKTYGEKYLALTPTSYDVVRALPEFSNQYQIGNDQNALATGILGQIKGFNVFRSQVTPQISAGSPAILTQYNLAFCPDAITLVTRNFSQIPQGLGAVSADIDLGGDFRGQLVWSYNPAALAQTFTIHVLYGVKTLRSTFMAQVRA